MKKLFSSISFLAVLANSLLYPFSVAHSQEVITLITPIPVIEEIATKSPEPTTDVASIPEIIDPTQTPNAISTPTVAPSNWTFENIEINKEYVFPQNDEVKLKFTKLPVETGNIKIEEITLSLEQIKQTGSLSDKAYDITSDMVDGTFSYDLSLPVPESSKGKNVEIKFAEQISNISSMESLDSSVSEQKDTVLATNIDHFTIFIVSSPVLSDPSCLVETGGTLTCYDSLQTAIDNSVNGDTLNLKSDIFISQRVNINKDITIDGGNFAIKPTFNKTSNSNNSSLAILSSGVTVQNLVIDGVLGTGLHGINIYSVTDTLIENIVVKDNDSAGVVVNGSLVTIKNITTSGNGWGGVNVDMGGGVTTEAKLTIDGINHHLESTHLWIDDITKTATVVDVLNRYDYSDFGNTRVFVLDISAPSVPVNGLPNGTSLTTNNFDFTWGASSGDPVITYKFQSSLNPAQNGGVLTTGLWSSPVLLSNTIHSSGASEGTLYWQVKAIDSAGNESLWSDIWSVSLDTIKPSTPLLVSPVNGSAVQPAGLILDWSDVTDASLPITYYYKSSWTGGNYGPVSVGANSQINASGSLDNSYAWQVMACDNAGNCSDWSGPWSITIDSVSPSNPGTPVVNVLSPTNQTNVSWNWVASSDSLSGVKQYFWNLWNGASNVVNGTTTAVSQNLSLSTYGDGDFTFDVQAEDNAGNKSDVVTSSILTVDTIAPDVELTSPTLTVVKGAVEIKGSVTDQNPHHYWLVIQNSLGVIVAGPGTVNNSSSFADQLLLNWNTNLVSDGSYTIRLEARDAANNKDSGSIVPKVITVDNNAPLAPIITIPNDGDYFSATPIVAHWNPVTDISGISKYQVGYVYDDHHTFSGSTCTDLPNGGCRDVAGNVNSRNHTPSISEQGGVTVYVRAIDGAGNKSAWSSPVHYVYDATAPVFTSKTIFNGWYTGSPVSIFVYSDINGIASGTPVTCEIITEGVGQTCSVVPNVCDLAGNCNTTPIVSNGADVDKTSPELNWISPLADETVTGIVPLNFSASDALSGINTVTYEYKRNDGIDTYHLTTSSWDTTALPLDTYILKVTVTDNAGNILEVTRQVNVASIISNEDSTTPTTDSAVITWTTDRPTKSRVVYDTVPHSLGTAPNYGYAFSTATFDSSPKVTDHSVTITGLSADTLYYYRVISEGSPVAIGNQNTYRTLSHAGAPGPSGDSSTGGQVQGAITSNLALARIQNEFGEDADTLNEEVLGEQTESDETVDKTTPKPEVKGIATKSWNAENIGLISLGSALIILMIILLIRKKKRS